MDEAEVRTFLLGAVVGLVLMGALWWLAAWRQRRRAAPPVIIQQIQLPIANPTLASQPDQSIETDIEADAVTPVEDVEKARYHRQLLSLSLELERVEQQNTKIEGQWRSSQHQLIQAEAGLDQARAEIADIRGIVLLLGATKSDEDVIDLR